MDIPEQVAEKLRTCELPPLSDLTQKIIHMTQDMYADPSDIAKLVKMDMSLSASVLKLANSVAFGYSGKVSSVVEAINRVGVSKMRDMVLSLSLVQQFKELEGIDFAQFWKHSLAVALASEAIERHSTGKKMNKDHTYSAGLLHKIGIVLLAQNFPEEYQKVLHEVEKDEKDLWELEKEILGVSHNEASHYVFDNWQFPQEVSHAALYYNDPVYAPDDLKEIIYTVHIANFACLNQGIGVGIDRFPESFFDDAWEYMKLHVSEIPEILEEVHDLADQASAIVKAAK